MPLIPPAKQDLQGAFRPQPGPMDRMTTKTLAEIYLKQGHFREAYDILKSLAEQDPANLEIQTRLKELREKLESPPPPAVEERIATLKAWLSAIQARRKK